MLYSNKNILQHTKHSQTRVWHCFQKGFAPREEGEPGEEEEEAGKGLSNLILRILAHAPFFSTLKTLTPTLALKEEHSTIFNKERALDK